MSATLILLSILFYAFTSKETFLISGLTSKDWYVKRQWHLSLHHPLETFTFKINRRCNRYNLWDGKKVEYPYGDVEVDETWKLKSDTTIEIHNTIYKIIRLDKNHFDISLGGDTIYMLADTTSLWFQTQ